MILPYIVESALWAALGVMALRIGADGPLWITFAFAIHFFGKASYSIFQAVGSFKGETRPAWSLRGFKVLALSYVIASSIAGLGALWQRSWLWLFVAYAAFSLAWLWFWNLRYIARVDSASTLR